MLTVALWVLRRRIDKWCLFGDGSPSGTFGPRKGGESGSTPGVGLKFWGS